MAESERLEPSDRRSDADLEGMGRQIRSYERQVREYLGNIDAEIDSYNFSLEKSGEGITIELGLRATLRPKHRERGM